MTDSRQDGSNKDTCIRHSYLNWIIVVTATFDRDLERLVRHGSAFLMGKRVGLLSTNVVPEALSPTDTSSTSTSILFPFYFRSRKRRPDPRSFTGPLFFSPSTAFPFEIARSRNNVQVIDIDIFSLKSIRFKEYYTLLYQSFTLRYLRMLGLD